MRRAGIDAGAARSIVSAVRAIALALAILAVPPAHGAPPGINEELVAAAARGDSGQVRRLIAAGADVNWQNAQRDSAFLVAGARGHTEVVRLTLAAGADLKSTNRYGGTALIPACHYGHVETVRLLLGTAIDVDHVNDLGWTALLETVILGDGGPAHVEILKLLLARGANPAIADREGVTPLAHARKRGFAEMVRLLSRAGGR
jgi:hypothetical protein